MQVAPTPPVIIMFFWEQVRDWLRPVLINYALIIV